MSTIVTLHVFSGRPDPSWELTKEQIAVLSEYIRSTTKGTLLKPPGVQGTLGYRGFTVRSFGEPMLDGEIYVHAGIIDLGPREINRVLDNSDLEEFLLSTGGKSVEPAVREWVLKALRGSRLFESRMALRPLVAPPFEPGKWNNDSYIRTNNNCYNYANDKLLDSFSQPGRGSGQQFTFVQCYDVSSASARDGQISIPNPNITPTQGYIICLVVAPGIDYHWYRRDSNNMWSHKPGQSPARNTDDSGNLISDPETCDRGDYTDVCGYFNCIPAHTTIA